jgi:hypothetical protein
MWNNIRDELHQPEYTGKNRCIPCTSVNVLIALGISAYAGKKNRITGVLAFLGSISIIYLRGYIVPGTPSLTKQYLPDEVLKHFEHKPPTTQVIEADGEINIESVLLTAGVIEPCEDIDEQDIAVALGYDEGDFTIAELNGGYNLLSEEELIAQWPSKGALLADFTAEKELSRRYSGWNKLTSQNKGVVLRGLRLFLDVFPTTGAPVEVSEQTVESCCRSSDVIAIRCSKTGQRLLEQPVDSAQ